MEGKEIIAKAIGMAQEKGRTKGLMLGTQVGHLSDKRIGLLESVNAKHATISYPKGEPKAVLVPVGEVFSIKDVENAIDEILGVEPITIIVIGL